MCSCTSLAAESRCVASASPSCSTAINLQLLNPAGSKSAYKVSEKALDQRWPTQLHRWANISDPILKRAAKLLLMTNSHYFNSYFSNFFDDFFKNLIFSPRYYLPKAYPRNFSNISTKLTSIEKFYLPKKIFPPLKKKLNLAIVKRAAQACQVGRMRSKGRVLDTPALDFWPSSQGERFTTKL